MTFLDVKKFDVVNPVIGKLATQVKTSKLTDYELTKKNLGQDETDKFENRFELFKERLDDMINNKDDENTGGGSGVRGGRGGERGGGGGDDGTPPRLPPDTYDRNSPAEDDERFQNRRLWEREREISNIPRGIVKFRKSSMDINFPDTLPATPYRDDYIPHPPDTPRETSFLFPEGSLSLLQNRLPNLVRLPSRRTIDNFARPLTRIIDEESNTIEITPKKPTPDINETNLSEQLQEIFPNVNEVIKKYFEGFKEKNGDLNEILNKIGKDDDDENDQKLFEFEFFTGGKNLKFGRYIRNFGLSSDN